MPTQPHHSPSGPLKQAQFLAFGNGGNNELGVVRKQQFIGPKG